MISHQVDHALTIALGIALLVGATLWWHRRERGVGETANRRLIGISVLSFFGLTFLLWSLHSEVSLHKDTLKALFASDTANGNASALILGLLGLVMTLVTMGVITIARNAIEDMRLEREKLDDHFRAIKGHNSELHLTQIRLQLLYENGEELKVLTTPGDEALTKLRRSLQIYYSMSDGVSGYLNYLDKYYRRTDHSPLSELERDYLLAIRDHYREYPEQDEDGDIGELISRVVDRV